MPPKTNPEKKTYSRQAISLAPMVDKSDRDWRWIMRRITRHATLYTEMITAPAVIRGNRKKLLSFDPSENPLVLQLAWNQAPMLAEACRIAEDFGYQEINLNCGCPSDKVQKNQFGAWLMANPDHTAFLVESMTKAVNIPVTVKNRIGIRCRQNGISLETYQDLRRFISTISQAGCQKFTVHARIAILDGLSPKDNREIPPLRPQDVYRLKNEFPHLFIEINGGYRRLEDIDQALENCDAVMLGRIALDNPWMLASVDQHCFGRKKAPSRREVLDAAIPYLIRRSREGASCGLLVQALMNLFAGCKGSKAWKRAMTKSLACGRKNFATSLKTAYADLDLEILDKRPNPII